MKNKWSRCLKGPELPNKGLNLTLAVNNATETTAETAVGGVNPAVTLASGRGLSMLMTN